MTKEELEKEAEEYVCKRNPLVTKEWFIDAFKKYNKGEKVKYLKDCEIAEYEAYIAGAEPREKRITELEKENAELKRSRWHNLRKNPQDLPKEDGAVLVVDMDYGHPGYKVALFWKEDGAFTGHYLAKLDVIAWREIPVFQEGE